MFIFNPEKRIAKIVGVFDKMVRELDTLVDESRIEQDRVDAQKLALIDRAAFLSKQKVRALKIRDKLSNLIGE